jgi:cold shock protein
VVYYLFDDRALHAHIKKLQGAIEAPSPPRRERKSLEENMFFGRMKMISERGYGFIARDDGQPDVFVHLSAASKAGISGLEKGDRVSFDIVPGRNGKTEAANLHLLDAEAA